MRFSAKSWKWAMGLTIGAVALVLLAPLAASRLVNLDAIKAEMTTLVSAEVEAKLSFSTAEFALLPRPHLSLRKPALVRADAFAVNAASAKFYPKLWPLLQGRFDPAEIRLESPEYTLPLPAMSPSTDESESAGRPGHVDLLATRTRHLVQALTALSLPNLDLHIYNGRVHLSSPGEAKTGFDLRHIYGRYSYHQQKLAFSFDCMSNLFKQITIKGWLNPITFKGVARMELSDFQPESLVDYLFPGAALQISEAQVSATIDIDSEGTDGIQASINGSVPHLNVSRGESSVLFSNQIWRGELALQSGRLTARLTDFTSASPRLNASGFFEIDDQQERVDLNLVGAEVDVASVREAALMLMGEDRTVADIFDVLRAGNVPRIRVAAAGRELRDLQQLENFVIEGEMLAGGLHIPDLDFDLRGVSGSAAIAEGILNGSRMAARMGNSAGTNGGMTLGLKDSRVFDLGIDVKADLAELPPVLVRLIDHRKTVAEMQGLSEISGSAAGRLTIARKAAGTSVKVDASAIQLTGRYSRIPYPVTISRGQVNFQDEGLTVAGIDAVIGSSSLKGLSGAVDWRQAVRLKLKAAALDLDNKETGAWLPKLAIGSERLQQAAEIGGKLALKEVVLACSVPASDGADLEFSGEVTGGVITTPRLPAPLVIESGGFGHHRNRLQLTRISAALGQSTLQELDATIDLSPDGEIRASSAQTVIVLEELFPWLARLAGGAGAFGDLSAVKGVVRLTGPKISGPLNQPAAWQWDTAARLEQIGLQSKTLGAPLATASADLTAARADYASEPGSRIILQPTEVLWGASRLRLAGDVGLFPRLIQLNLQVAADQLQWPQIEQMLAQNIETSSSAKTAAIVGEIGIRANAFQYGAQTWQPVITTLTIAPRQVNLAVEKAGLCDITFSGRVTFAAGRVDLQLAPLAADKPMAETVACLTSDKAMVTGRFDFSGELTADAPAADLRRSVFGDLSLAAAGGRIHRFGVLAKIFSILNVTEIYRGQMPDLSGEGFPYESMTITADIEQSKLRIQKCAVEAQSMGLACEGEIDLAERRMDVVILVAPFRTADRIVKHIPVVGGILGGKLISIPFRATGALDDPTVIPLSPTAVGSGVLGILERTLKLPITLVQPLFSKSKPESPSAPSQGQE